MIFWINFLGENRIMLSSNLSNMNFNNDYGNFLPPSPPRLIRTYKAFCSNCNKGTAIVFNSERVGGVCWSCSTQIKSAVLIKNWYKVERKRKRNNRKKYTGLVLLRKTHLGIQSGLYENVTKFI